MRWVGVGVGGQWSDGKGAVSVVVHGDVGMGSELMLFDPVRGETEGGSLAGEEDFADGKRSFRGVGATHIRTILVVIYCG